MSKMGISVISSYRGELGGRGAGRAICAEYFPGMISRISGIGVAGLQRQARPHARGWASDQGALPIGGFYKARATGEKHAHDLDA